jgi:hypothetical protein
VSTIVTKGSPPTALGGVTGARLPAQPSTPAAVPGAVRASAVPQNGLGHLLDLPPLPALPPTAIGELSGAVQVAPALPPLVAGRAPVTATPRTLPVLPTARVAAANRSAPVGMTLFALAAAATAAGLARVRIGRARYVAGGTTGTTGLR